MGGTAKVLVVEDDTDVREALLLLLEQEGIGALGAANGRDALDRIEGGFLPKLILLDLMMPVMDGERFLHLRMGDERLQSIPVVVVTALQRMRVDPAELNVDAIIPKPVDPSRVIATVRQYA